MASDFEAKPCSQRIKAINNHINYDEYDNYYNIQNVYVKCVCAMLLAYMDSYQQNNTNMDETSHSVYCQNYVYS